MGIPSYFRYILRRYRSINQPEVLNDPTTVIDYFFIDCNSIVYDAFRSPRRAALGPDVDQATLYKVVIDDVLERILSLASLVRPRRLMYIAFDGVAPLAKIAHQRTRRYKSLRESLAAEGQSTSASETLCITPGTQFMSELAHHLSAYFAKHVDITGAFKVIVSSSDEEGEGEQKLFAFIRAYGFLHPYAPAYPTQPQQETAGKMVLFGMDADLFMLSILHLGYMRNIYLLRPRENNNNPNPVQAVVAIPEDTEDDLAIEDSFHPPLPPIEDYSYDILDIGELRMRICQSMGNGSVHRAPTYNAHMAHQYLFATFFLGNDFVRHAPCLNLRTNGMDVVMDALRRTCSEHHPLVSIHGLTAHHDTPLNPHTPIQVNIYWRQVAQFIRYIAKYELQLLAEIWTDRENMESKLRAGKPISRPPKNTSTILPEHELAAKDRKECWPLLRREAEKYVCVPAIGWQVRYYRVCFDGLEIDSPAGQIQLREICRNYIRSLEWTLHYYVGSPIVAPTQCPFVYPYHHAPLLADVHRHLSPASNYYSFLMTQHPGSTHFHVPLSRPISPLFQLALVMPLSILESVLPNTNDDIREQVLTWAARKKDVLAGKEEVDAATELGAEHAGLWFLAKFHWEAAIPIPFLQSGQINDLVADFPF